jgi:colicin import membrane protein
VTGDSLEVSLQKLNNSLSGTARELAKTNPEIKNMTEEQLKAGGAIDVISSKYNGMAEAMRGSLEVQQKVAEQARGDAMEALGEALAPAAIAVTKAFTGIIEGVTAVINVFNNLPEPLKFVIGSIGALTAGMVAYTLIQKSALIQTGLQIAKDVIMAVKQAAVTAVTWLRNTAQVALNASMIVGNTLTGVGIALVGAAIVAGAAYASSQGNMAQSTDELNDETKKLNDTIDKQIGIFSSWGDIIQVIAIDAISESLSLSREEMKAYANIHSQTAGAIKLSTESMKKGFIDAQEALKRQITALERAVSTVQNTMLSLNRETKEGKELYKTAEKNLDSYTRMLIDTKTKLASYEEAEKKKADALKAAEDAKKEAIKIEQERKKYISDTIEKLKEELATIKLNNVELVVYNLQKKKATQAEIDKAVSLQKSIDATKEQIEKEKEAIRLIKEKNDENDNLKESSGKQYKDLLQNLQDEAARVTKNSEEYKKYIADKNLASDITLVKSMGLEGEAFDNALKALTDLRAKLDITDVITNNTDKVSLFFTALQEKTKNLFSTLSAVGETFNAIGNISQNIHDGELMRIEEQNEKNKESWNERIKQAEAEGATVEQIDALKAQAQTDQETRDKEYRRMQKKYARENAINAKINAVFMSAINGAGAIIKGFAEGGWPLGIATIAMVAAQQAAILAQPIPEAQFGGSFVVPPGFSGDSGLLKVNSGERVDVTPSRQSDNTQGGKMVLSINGREFDAYMEEQVNSALNSGRVTTNRRGVVRA